MSKLTATALSDIGHNFVNCLEVGDVIVHKGIEFSKVAFAVKEIKAAVTIAYIHPGNALFTETGLDCSIVVAIT